MKDLTLFLCPYLYVWAGVFPLQLLELFPSYEFLTLLMSKYDVLFNGSSLVKSYLEFYMTLIFGSQLLSLDLENFHFINS